MQRFLLAIAVLFAIASTLGSALTGALAADVATVPFTVGIGPTAASCDVPANHERAPVFRPCGKMKNGMAIPCSIDQAILPALGCEGFPAAALLRPMVYSQGGREEPLDSHFRPPRTLEGSIAA